ncbi:MAG: gas vesicle protein GvpG [Actinomycetota bacterium]|nr:gas vesicle protein GvpG [Actinomycetota bacterium]
MGILGRVLLLPLLPLEGMVWLARLLEELGDRELNDPTVLRERLDEAERAHRAGEIGDNELAEIERVILDRLFATRNAGGMP